MNDAKVTTGGRLLSPQQLAEHLSVPLQTVYKWRREGHGPKGIKLGRHVRNRPEEVGRWLEEQAKR